MSDVRALVLASARSWIGTRYTHQQSVKHVGCDCLGFLRGVWREVIGPEPTGERMPNYTPTWAEQVGQEWLMDVCDRHLIRIDHEPIRRGADIDNGDIVLFRMFKNGPAKHGAITVTPNRIIHSYYAARYVTETALAKDWRDKIAAAFAFPGAV